MHHALCNCGCQLPESELPVAKFDFTEVICAKGCGKIRTYRFNPHKTITELIEWMESPKDTPLPCECGTGMYDVKAHLVGESN